MESTITFNTLIEVGAIIIGFWGFIKVIKEIIKVITERHDREEAWDKLESEMTAMYKQDQATKWAEYDAKIKGVEDKVDNLGIRVEEMSNDLEARTQEIKAEQCMLTYCMLSVLDGLQQLGADGKVTDASLALSKWMNKQAHGVPNEDNNR